ncbi:DUF397 domain-containing protein [Streptomyces sp. NPDC127110]|uniref:DUF397 domain-containing protein n=1 Tax=Streptomyces sp. NPDC127110 TaxID=3345362 RepID=UPI003642A4F0
MTSIDTKPPYGQWFKSSYSGDASGNCVEACRQPGAIHIRDTKCKDEAGAPVLGFTATAWSRFALYIGGNR